MERYTDTISGEELYVFISFSGGKHYCKDKTLAILHRLDGPAVERADGIKEWWVDNTRHRLDGPAYEGADGIKAYYVDGVFIMKINKGGKIIERMK